MASTGPLSAGALAAIFAAGCESPKDAWSNPVLQVLLVKKIDAQGNTPERYRIVLSDGLHFTQGMVGTQINHIMAEGTIDKGSIVRLPEYGTGKVKDKSVLIVLNIELLQEHGTMEKIGDPKQVTPESAAELAAQKRATSTSNFYGNKPSTASKPAAAASTSRPPARYTSSRGGSSVTVAPIESLSPYQNKWTIKARCINKSDIRTWHNQKNAGKLFSVTLMDQTGEIKATAFNDQCDNLFEFFEEGSVYYVSKCRVQIAKKQFSNVDNDYELTFEKDSEVEKAEDADDIPMPTFNFVTLEDLQTAEKDAVVDVIGVIKEIGDVSSITSKTTQKSFNKREIGLVDNTGYNVKLTIWGKMADSFSTPPESVVAFKGVKVSDFGGRSLSMVNSSSMQVDPDLEEAHRLKGWFDGEGRDSKFQSHQGLNQGQGSAAGKGNYPYKTVQQIADEHLGLGEQADGYTLKGTISYIRSENMSYPACKGEGCQKKVREEGGKWICEKCNLSWPSPEYRYIMTCSVLDHTGQAWLNVFDDAGKVIMGTSATDLEEMRNFDTDAADAVMKKALLQTFTFRVRAKNETYQDVQRVRNNVVAAHKIDYVAESRRLKEIIDLYNPGVKAEY
ncbi:hypothetical protein ABW19_dt0201204 [Dactylella cylindrospora]|nr:hypothetical protein ABW19_dt0201204 [Dactylella cylindrospora]